MSTIQYSAADTRIKTFKVVVVVVAVVMFPVCTYTTPINTTYNFWNFHTTKC